MRVQVRRVLEKLFMSLLPRGAPGGGAAGRRPCWPVSWPMPSRTRAGHGSVGSAILPRPCRIGAVPPYFLALVALTADEAILDELGAEVARDVARGEAPGRDEVASSRAAVDWLLAALRVGAVPDADALAVLREGAASEARAGRPLQPVLDRTLSAGWVTWDRITTRETLGADALRALGDALLRTGDAAAAAIADGHAAAEREIATRSASALRELLDAILDLSDDDEAGRARLVRRAGELAIPLDRPLTVIVADAGRDLEDGDRAVADVARRLVPGMTPHVGDPRSLGGPQPGPVVAASAGRLVVLVPETRRQSDVAAALALARRRLDRDERRRARPARDRGRRPRGDGGALRSPGGAGTRDRSCRRRRWRSSGRCSRSPTCSARPSSGSWDRCCRRRAVRGSRTPSRRTSPSARTSGRRRAGLGVAPRTVAYRLERIERLLGGRLDASRRARLATALFARRLLGDPDAG